MFVSHREESHDPIAIGLHEWTRRGEGLMWKAKCGYLPKIICNLFTVTVKVFLCVVAVVHRQVGTDISRRICRDPAANL